MNTAQTSAIAALAEISGTSAADIEPKMDLVADLGIDSPKALQLLIEIEDRVGIEISDEDAEALNTVEDLLTYLEAAAAG